ncbi:MAG TPA: hypothetical protein VLU73_00105 [Methylococcaceae bacterium]|nr:hypothetical protein [Methylococcaceae bacterium]
MIGGDLILPILKEGVVLILESLELMVDTLFEELLHFAPEVAQLATAWTGLILLIALLIWGSVKLKAVYYRLRAAAPVWWAAQMNDTRTWWESLIWYHQVLVVACGVGVLLLMLMFL